MPDPYSYLTAGRKQFARHEWAQKAAYLLGCSLEELSSAIFKHQHKGGTLQRSTSFRQGPEESSLGDGTGTLAPGTVDVIGKPHLGLVAILEVGGTAGMNRCSHQGEGLSPRASC